MPPNEFRVLVGSRAIEHDPPALMALAAGADDGRAPPGGAHELAAGSHHAAALRSPIAAHQENA